MSCLVCFLYAVKAVLKIVSKFVEEVAADETWDIVEVCSENDKNVPGWPLRHPDIPRADRRPVHTCEALQFPSSVSIPGHLLLCFSIAVTGCGIPSTTTSRQCWNLPVLTGPVSTYLWKAFIKGERELT